MGAGGGKAEAGRAHSCSKTVKAERSSAQVVPGGLAGAMAPSSAQRLVRSWRSKASKTPTMPKEAVWKTSMVLLDFLKLWGPFLRAIVRAGYIGTALLRWCVQKVRLCVRACVRACVRGSSRDQGSALLEPAARRRWTELPCVTGVPRLRAPYSTSLQWRVPVGKAPAGKGRSSLFIK